MAIFRIPRKLKKIIKKKIIDNDYIGDRSHIKSTKKKIKIYFAYGERCFGYLPASKLLK